MPEECGWRLREPGAEFAQLSSFSARKPSPWVGAVGHNETQMCHPKRLCSRLSLLHPMPPLDISAGSRCGSW